jgi:hypothetical protein
MPSTSLLNHIANFFLPSLVLALSLGLSLAVVGAWRCRKNSSTQALRVTVVLFLVGALTQVGLVLLGFKDGSIEGYAAWVGVLALMHWLLTWRNPVR